MLKNLDFSGEIFLPEEVRTQYTLRKSIKEIIVSQCLFYCGCLMNTRIAQDPTFRIGFLGCGDMGEAILAQLIDSGYKPSQIIVSTRHPEKLIQYISQGVDCRYDNAEVVRTAKFIFLCCAAGHINEVSSDCRPVLKKATCGICSIIDNVTKSKVCQLFSIDYSFRTIINIDELNDLLEHNELKDMNMNELSLQQLTSNPIEIIEIYKAIKFILQKNGIKNDDEASRMAFYSLFGKYNDEISMDNIDVQYFPMELLRDLSLYYMKIVTKVFGKD